MEVLNYSVALWHFTFAGDFTLWCFFTSANVAKLCWFTWWFQQSLPIYQRHTNDQWILQWHFMCKNITNTGAKQMIPEGGLDVSILPLHSVDGSNCIQSTFKFTNCAGILRWFSYLLLYTIFLVEGFRIVSCGSRVFFLGGVRAP